MIIADAWWLGGYDPQLAFFGIKLSTAGLLGFFAISGFLTTVDAQRSPSFSTFAVARLAPFYAGLVVAGLAMAFFAAPLSALLTGGHYSLRDALTFLGVTLALVNGVSSTPSIGTSLQGNPDYVDWNGLLWTLTWEALCFVIVTAVVFLLRRAGAERHAPALTALLLGTAVIIDSSQAFAGGFAPDRSAFVLPLVAFFLAGSLLAHYRDRVRVELLPAMLAAALALAFLVTGLGPALAALPLTYLVLAVGSLRSRFALRHDISYGVYIYGWPIQQLLAAMHLPAVVPPLAYAGVALVAVWPVAFLSCTAVEQPAQRWRRAWQARRAHQTRHAMPETPAMIP